MNILFVSFDADPPNMGGTATVINIMARYFYVQSNNVALGFLWESTTPSVFFKKIWINQRNREEMIRFENEFHTDIIYAALANNMDWKLVKECFPKAKIVSAYHNRPQINHIHWESLIMAWRDASDILNRIRVIKNIIEMPYTIQKQIRQQKKQYDNLCKYSDKIHILSPKFEPVFRSVAPLVKDNQIVAIPNPLVFSKYCSDEELLVKEKRVLVVTSINYQKRAYLMMKIWQMVEQDEELEDWYFDFVGDGVGYNHIKNLAKKYNLKRIAFYGKQKPIEYYRTDSIFIMTSRYEGWPMVLMESMQMGVVPVVFNSFESITDIIDNGKDGFIVENNNLEKFYNCMKSIMINEKIRYNVAKASIEKSRQFALDNIGNQYIRLFESLLTEEK